MSTLLGFVVGYVVGARQGPDGYARIRQKIDAMLDSPELRALVDRGAELSELLTSARNGGNGQRDGHESGARNGAADGVTVVDQLRSLLDGNGQLRATWQTIADSELVQTVVATGLSFAGDLFDRGKAMLDERWGRPE